MIFIFPNLRCFVNFSVNLEPAGKLTFTLTYEELLKFDFGIWFSKKFKNEKILSLAKALDFFYINNIGVNIELKPNKGKEKDNIESITKVIKSKKILPNYFFSSFDTSSLKFVKRNFPNSPRGFLIDNYSFYDKKDIIEICKELKCFCELSMF